MSKPVITDFEVLRQNIAQMPYHACQLVILFMYAMYGNYMYLSAMEADDYLDKVLSGITEEERKQAAERMRRQGEAYFRHAEELERYFKMRQEQRKRDEDKE